MTVLLPGEARAGRGEPGGGARRLRRRVAAGGEQAGRDGRSPFARTRLGTLVQALSGHGLAGGEDFRPGVVHRLDKDTSGLLVVAKSTEAHRRLVAMMRRRAVDRRYLALVHGSFAADSGTIEAPVGRDPVRRNSMTVGGLAAREATTHFTRARAPGRSHAGRGPAGDRAHPPDPRPLRGHRPPGGRRSHSMPGAIPWASGGSSCTATGWRFRTPSPGKTSSSRPRCRPTSQAVLLPAAAKLRRLADDE